MALVNRPYAGTWQPNRRTVVQQTPDALVYLNGNTSLPGCATCHHNISIQEFITSVSVDVGVEPGAGNSSISMSIPRHYGDSIFRDGNTLLRPGLEVHVYMRGHFPMKGLASAGVRVAGVDLGDIPQYPYYPVFHGVVTSVTDEYSGGYYTASLTCNGMLHFWQHFKLASSGSFFGARPANSRVNTTLTGHPFHGMTPYAIIYNLYRDTAGAAAGVGYGLASRTNYGAVSTVTRDSLFALTLRYWERRFRERAYGLRMHGASGQLFTSSQQAYLSQFRDTGAAGRFLSANINARTARNNRDIFAQDQALLLGLADRRDGRVLRQPDLGLLPSADGGRLGLSATQMQAFMADLGQQGQVNFFETTYESKLDVATAVTNVSGYEFYQDVDGDLVFKPPLYNLDTSSSRVYRIEPEDILSISKTEGEPEATYVIVKSSAVGGMTGVIDEEWGARTVYINYPLVAQFGWREHSIETQYFGRNAKAAFFAGVAQLDRLNAGVNSCTITIPLRPEIRPGYPVYIPHLDCYYYVQSLSHALSYGSDCTTTLNLVARRRKFIAPGNSSGNGLSAIDLSGTHLPPKPLQALTGDRVPRLIGYPNVVMALDPTKINPLFYVYGFQAEEATLTTGNSERREINRSIFLTNFVQVLWERGLIAARSNPTPASGTTAQDFLGNPRQEFTIPADGFRDLVLTMASLTEALGAFIRLRDASRNALPTLEARLTELQRNPNDNAAEIVRVRQSIANLRATFDPATVEGGAEAFRQRYTNTTEALATAGSNGGGAGGGADGHAPPSSATGDSNAEQVVAFAYLINQVRIRSPAANARDMTMDPTGSINESANVLELLNDRKASMSVNTPGIYRYYSSASPDPAQQGYEPIDTTDVAFSSVAGEGGPGGTVGGTTTSSNPAPSNGEVPATLTPAGRRRPPGTSARQLRIDTHQVNSVRTRESMEAIVRLLNDAWRRLRGTDPPGAVLAVLAGQVHRETGNGRKMYNFNFGGQHWEGGNRPFSLSNHQRFSAYASAEEGAQAYIQRLLDTYITNIDRVLAAGTAEQATRTLIDQIMSRGYAGPAAAREGSSYRADLARYATTALAPGGLISRALPPGGGGTSGASSNPEGTVTETVVALPPEELHTTALRPATDVEGLSPELGNLVERSTHVPTNGLRVRTFTSTEPRVVPTSHITTMTFEERPVARATVRPTVVLRAGVTAAQAVAFFRSCLAGNSTLINALAASFAATVTPAGLNQQRAATALVAAAVAGISGLKGSNGHLIASANIAAGTPNTVADPAAAITGAEAARGVLARKARALLSEVTAANREALDHAIATLNQRGPNSANQPIPTEVAAALGNWQDGLGALFRGRGVPAAVPFQTVRDAHVVRAVASSSSPVFPISDERGYEHYGIYAYGRGLSIEPGGNYERLMAQDPFHYANPEDVDRFVATLRRSVVRGADGRLQLSGNTRRSLLDVATRLQGTPGEQAALRFVENADSQGDRTTMIANGLANYILSDRDSITKLPLSNAAYTLTDLAPQGQADTCACRGAEADLLLGAYMAGANAGTFVAVASADEAAAWVKEQMTQAVPGWNLAQSLMQGQADGRSPASLLSSISEWPSLVGGAVRDATQPLDVAAGDVGSELDRLNDAAARIGNRRIG